MPHTIAPVSARAIAPVRARSGRGHRRCRQPKAIPTASGGIARLAHQQARTAGLDVAPLLARAALTAQQIAGHHIRIPVGSQIKFLDVVAHALQDEFLGIRLAQQFDLRQVGLLYYVLASSPTLDDALQRAARYSGVNNEGIRISYRRHRSASLTFHHAGVSRVTDRHQIEFFMTALLRLCRQLVGREFMPERIAFVHRRTELPADLKPFFGCPVTFGHKADELSFPNRFAALAVLGADPFLNALLVKYCEEVIAQRRVKSGSWRLRVENAMARLLPHGEARMPDICRELGVSARTLARRLAAEGVTFGEVLDALRRDLATRHLEEDDLPISEIAWLVGYRQTSSFNHAFKRWTGKIPGELRRHAADK